MEVVFLLIVVGGSAFVYNIFAPAYYRHQKSRVIEKAYEEVRRMDLTELQDEDLEVFKTYEAENLTFTIADDQMQPIYTTSNLTPQNQNREDRKSVV